MTGENSYETIRVTRQREVCRLQLHRPGRGNSITDLMVEEMHDALDGCEGRSTVLILAGSPEVFCTGADLDDMAGAEPDPTHDPSRVFELWQRLSTAPLVSVACVEGRVNAGGVGMAAACDVVVASPEVAFSLSELLFGLTPAMVLPFLARRVGYHRARYLALTTRPIDAATAHTWGLVDVLAPAPAAAVAQLVPRLARLRPDVVDAFKQYVDGLRGPIDGARDAAVAMNRASFTDSDSLSAVREFVRDGQVPQAPTRNQCPDNRPKASVS